MGVTCRRAKAFILVIFSALSVLAAPCLYAENPSGDEIQIISSGILGVPVLIELSSVSSSSDSALMYRFDQAVPKPAKKQPVQEKSVYVIPAPSGEGTHHLYLEWEDREGRKRFHSEDLPFLLLPERESQSSWMKHPDLKARVGIEFLTEQLSVLRDIPAVMTITNTGKVPLPGRSNITAVREGPVFYAGAYYERENPKEPGTFLATVGLTRDLMPGESFRQVIRVPAPGDSKELLVANGWLVCVDEKGIQQGFGVREVSALPLAFGNEKTENRIWILVKKNFSSFLVCAYALLVIFTLSIFGLILLTKTFRRRVRL